MYLDSLYLYGSKREKSACFQGRHARVDAVLLWAKAGSASPERLTIPPVKTMVCFQARIWVSQQREAEGVGGKDVHWSFSGCS
eukprot:12506874-Prorocentrum_lima.AAC.1